MEIITGRTGTQHVKAVDDAEIYRTLLGDGDFVLSTGQKLNATMSGTNQVNIQNGTAIMQGRQCKIRPSEGFNGVSIDNGVTGYKRWDIVCLEYTIEDGIESADLIVVKGANSTTWTEPTVQYLDTSIDSGETHRMKLWGVRLDGINFDSLVDYRTILDTSPVNTMLDRMTAIEEQIKARIASLELLGRSVPQYTVTAHDVTFEYSSVLRRCRAIFDPPTGYTKENTDVYDLYLNGLRISRDDYDWNTAGGNNVDVTINFGTTSDPVPNSDTVYEDVTVIIWKAVE